MTRVKKKFDGGARISRKRDTWVQNTPYDITTDVSGVISPSHTPRVQSVPGLP